MAPYVNFIKKQFLNEVISNHVCKKYIKHKLEKLILSSRM